MDKVCKDTEVAYPVMRRNKDGAEYIKKKKKKLKKVSITYEVALQ